MNKDNLLRGIFWIVLAAGFAGLIMASYAIYTRQVGKIELLKKNLKETHLTLKEAKNELSETKDNATILAARKDSLIEKVFEQEDRIEKFQQERKNLEDKTEGLSARKRELEATLEKTRKSLKEQIKLQELRIAELEEDFLKRSAMEKAMFSTQEEKLNVQVMAAEVLLEALTKKNEELLNEARENKQKLVRLIDENEGEGKTKSKAEMDYKAKGAENESRLREKISNLNKMIEQNKKLINKNEKIIIDVTNEKEKIADRFRQTEEQFNKEALKLHYNLGLAYDETRQHDEALAEYEKALKISQLDPDLHYNMAIIYDEHFNKMAKAIEHYKAYLKLSPNAEDAEKVIYWIDEAEEELKYNLKQTYKR